MTPTLSGRIQTRIALLALVGVPWTMVLAPLLPGGVRYGQALASLLVIAVLGVGWELLYHGLQQLRWDRDWPSLFALAAGVPEGLLAWPVLRMLGLAPRSPLGYVLYFGTMWLLIWLVSQGPVRVFAPRWRHTGGRLLPHRLRESAPAPDGSSAAAAPVACAVWALGGLVPLLTLSGSTGVPPHDSLSVRPNREFDGRVEPVSLTVPHIAASSMLIRLGLDAGLSGDTAGGQPTPAGGARVVRHPGEPATGDFDPEPHAGHFP